MNPTEEKPQEENKESKPSSVFLKNYDRSNVLTELNATKDYLMAQGIKPEWGIFELYSIYHCYKQNKIQKNKCFGAKVRVPYEQYALAEKIDLDIKTNQKKLARAIDLQCNKYPGDLFEPLQRLSLPGTSTEDISISHEKGKILLLAFWRTWCRSSLDLPQNLNAMLEKNKAQWKDKLQAICIGSERESPNNLSKLLKSNPCDNLVHYEALGLWDHPSIRMYGIRAFPHIILCDKEGIIRYSGHPDKIALEDSINSILENVKSDSTTLITQWTDKPSIEATEFKTIKEQLEQEAGEELCKLNTTKNQRGFFGVGLTLKRTQVFDLALNSVASNLTKLTLNLSVLDIERERVTNLIEEKLNKLPKELYEINAEALQSFKFEFGKNCTKCNGELPETKPQYFCPFDQLYYCKTCAEAIDSSKTGTEKLVEAHPLLYVNVRRADDLKRLILSRVSGALQCPVLEEGEEESYARNHAGIACDACTKDLVDTTRWKCVNCLDLDICGGCFEKLESGDDTVKNALRKAGHDEESHCYVRFYYKAVKL